MFTVIGIMLCGVLTGFLLRKKPLNGLRYVITGLIWLLLFILGIEVGHNKEIILGLEKLGLQATLITLGAVAGSLLAAWGVWKYDRKRSTRAAHEK